MGVVGRLNQQIFEVISNYLSINLSSWLNCLLMWSEANYLTFLGFYHTIVFLQMKQITASGENNWQSLKEKISFHWTWKRKKKWVPFEDYDSSSRIWLNLRSQYEPWTDWNSGSSRPQTDIILYLVNLCFWELKGASAEYKIIPQGKRDTGRMANPFIELGSWFSKN